MPLRSTRPARHSAVMHLRAANATDYELVTRLFAEAYDWLGPLAVVRVRQLVSETAPELARLVEHHTTEDLLAERIAVGG